MSSLNPEEYTEEIEGIDSESNANSYINPIIDEIKEFYKKKSQKRIGYEVLNTEQIVEQKKVYIEMIKDVMDGLMPLASISTLLKYCKWDTNLLFEMIFRKDNHKKLSNIVGIVCSEPSSEMSPIKRSRLECNICCAAVQFRETYGLNCGHFYCKKCWNEYLITKVVSDGNVNEITCAETHCKVIVDEEQVLQLLNDNDIKVRHQTMTTNLYVENNPLLRWCPKPDCGHAFSVEISRPQPVICICGTQICFSCGQTDHEPIDCHLFKEWNKKCEGKEGVDGQTANWMLSMTKECPKCETVIEKSGGCNHMTCTRPACKYEFCWVCLGEWDKHQNSYYDCRFFNKDKPNQIKQSALREHLENFMFYWNRFNTYERDLQSENELQSTVISKMLQMQDKLRIKWTKAQFMKEAVEILSSCRQTIMYSYVFAYFNQKSRQFHIFEANLRDLQKSVESLSQDLEQEINNEEDLKIVKSKVLSLMNYCQMRKKVLINDIIEGK